MKSMSVLIVEDDRGFATVLALRCKQLGLTSRIAGTATCAVTMMADELPDLILLDIEIPRSWGDSATRHGLVVCEKLPQSVFSAVPVIVLTGSDDEETKACCRSTGTTLVRKGPDAWFELKPAIESLLNLNSERPAEPVHRAFPQLADADTAAPHAPKILCVDDDPDINLAVGMRLRQLGAYPIRAFSGAQGFQTALQEMPDLILTDLHMPNGEGNYLISRLKTNPATQHIPIIVLTAVWNHGVERILRAMGADGFLNKPLDIEQVIVELSRFVKLPKLQTRISPCIRKES